MSVMGMNAIIVLRPHLLFQTLLQFIVAFPSAVNQVSGFKWYVVERFM